MKKFITMLLTVAMLSSAIISVSADDTYTGSVESAPTTSTEIIGSDGKGNTYIAKGNDESGSEVLVSGGSTVIINAASTVETELEEEHKVVIEEAKVALEQSQKEIIDNAKDLTVIFPELKQEPTGKPGPDDKQEPQKEYAVARLEAVISYGEDAAKMEQVINAQEELTIGLNKDFGYSKADGDKIAIKFADGNWKMIPQKDIHFDEAGHLTISFVPESVSYQIALIKEVKAEKDIDTKDEKKNNKKKNNVKFVGNFKALQKVSAKSNAPTAGWAVRTGR